MSKKETDKRYGKRSKTISARITEADYEILKKNNIAYSFAIEEYIDNNLNVYARQQYILRQKEKQLAEIEKAEREKPALIKEIEDLRKSIGYTLIDGLEVSPEANSSAERFAGLFVNSHSKYTDLDEYIKENEKEINEKALDNKLSMNAFSKLIYKHYEILFAEKESENQEKEIALINKYANVSENLSENALKQISNAVRVAERNILGKKSKYKDIDAFIKGNDKYINRYVSKCDLSKDKFIDLTKEAYYNLIEN